MAAIAIVMGSVLGFLGAVLGWAFLDMSVVTAFGLYLATSLGFGMVVVLSMLASAEPEGRAFAQTARG